MGAVCWRLSEFRYYFRTRWISGTHDCSSMIAHLRGKLIHKQPGQAIVEAAGVGYDVVISVPTFTALPAVGAEASLHIHTQVSDDQIALFGFLHREEKRLFERLITVSGVGPKLAVKMLS